MALFGGLGRADVMEEFFLGERLGHKALSTIFQRGEDVFLKTRAFSI